MLSEGRLMLCDVVEVKVAYEVRLVWRLLLVALIDFDSTKLLLSSRL